MSTLTKTCFIAGAGSFDGMSIRPQEDDLIIAADGGYEYLKNMNIEPHVLIGDFDSLEIVPEHRHLIRHSPIKDDTDMALAAAYAMELGYRRFFLYGGLGGRLDHTIANLQLLTGMSKNGMEAYLIGEGIILTAISGKKEELTGYSEEISFDANASGMISVFSMGDSARGIWEKGLKYELSDAVMTNDKTLGVSNEFLGCESSVSVGEGTILIMWDEKNGLPVWRRKKEVNKYE